MTTGQRPFDSLFPPFPEGFVMPFWYASLQSLWLYYLVEPDVLSQRIPALPGDSALHPARFIHDGREWCLASLDLQIYTGHGSSFLETVREVEFNIYAYPVASEPVVPLMSVDQFLAGQDQTKTLGGFRLHVPCDNENAVQAGRGLFGEPKYLAQVDYDVPGLNQPDVKSWTYSVHQDHNGQRGPLIWGQTIDLSGLETAWADPSPLVEYGVLEEQGARRLVANRWTFYGPFATYHLGDSGEGRVKTTYGTNADPTGTLTDLQSLISDTPPLAAQLFQSAPVSSESRAWYLAPG